MSEATEFSYGTALYPGHIQPFWGGGMVLYRRNRVPGGTYFFTVNLKNRTLSLLADHIDKLRESVRYVLHKRPFRIDARVVLPEHLHAVWTLPMDDHDYSGR